MELVTPRQIQVIEGNFRPKLPLKYISLDSSGSSISSVILSMCPLSIDSDRCLLTNDNQLITKATTSSCKKLISTNQCDEKQLTLTTYSFQVNSNCREFKRLHSSNIETQFTKTEKLMSENDTNETVVLTQSKTKKRLNYRTIMRLLNLQAECESSPTDSSLISTKSCLNLLLLRPQLSNKTDEIETTEPSSPPVFAPIRLQISPKRIDQFKQRQIVLEDAVKKLLETVRIEGNENIKQISKYLSYLKQLCLDKYQLKANCYQFFDYLLKPTFSNKEFERYCEQNDEIKAALQVLSTTLTIVEDKHSFSTINQLFDNEEKLIIANLYSQLESLLSSYTDEFSFIRERIHFYQSNFNEEKNFDWIQLIQIDYPCLIENISNDFIIKTPQIEEVLIQMLRNMKKHLLNIHTEINKK